MSHHSTPLNLNSPCKQPSAVRSVGKVAFSLIELLVVIGISAILLSLSVAGINAIKQSGGLTSATADVTGALHAAASYAVANNTYVWVGFFEEDISATTRGTPGVGRLVVSTVASADGSRYNSDVISASKPAAFGSSDPSNRVTLVQVGKPLFIENVHLMDTPPTTPTRPKVEDAHNLGHTDFSKDTSSSFSIPTTFNYPLGTTEYTFRKIIEFSPRGEAIKILDRPVAWIELALQSTHGSVVSPGTNYSIIQLGGLTGQTILYRP